MIAFCLAAILMVQTAGTNAAPAATSPGQPVAAAGAIDLEVADKLLKVKRIFVESFGDDAISKQIQAMTVNSLQASKKFIITENKDRADAVLKGTALEKTSQELHAIGEGTSVAGAAGSHSGSMSGSFANGAGAVAGHSSGGFVAHAAGISDSQASTETINDARVAVRLVSTDGDVLWSSTQESTGAKYKGASADVADKVVKQLLRDLEKLQKKPTAN